ncbi:MAG: D-alanyl-D-alanine carboxypeptidase [Alphaproteobacteria bacterium]|nr:D-alanyl-D-alanine carboxypeptidase [Alphaproteobacteria bacterium]
MDLISQPFYAKRPFWRALTILLVTVALAFGASAQAAPKAKGKKRASKAAIQRVVPAKPPEPTPYADLVIEARTGRILLETDSTASRQPASLTKMMTLYIVFQALENGVLRLDTPLEVSALAATQPPSKIGLKAGQKIRAQDAILALVTQSANDVSVVLAEALGGSVEGFAELMGRQARALGMQQSVFENPHGLPCPTQITSARDMAKLGYALVYHHPGFYPYFSQMTFHYNGRIISNHNRLMERYQGMDGIKTGYIKASGFNLVASAERDGVRLIGVVFGGSNARARDDQMEQLLDEGFDLIDKRPHGHASDHYIALPSKVAAAFPHARAARYERQPRHAPRPPALETSQPPQWGIQVGAFSDVAGAQRALTSMAYAMTPLLDGAEQSLQKITVEDGSAMYRARFMKLDQTTARAACSYMVRHGQGCLVISGS